jgi:hypothetical protein
MHIGEKIQKRAKEMRMGPTELAGLINTSKQNIYGIFKRKSIDTDLLSRIGKALDFDFFQYYVKKSNEKDYEELKEKYEILKKYNELLEKQT